MPNCRKKKYPCETIYVRNDIANKLFWTLDPELDQNGYQTAAEQTWLLEEL